jgi:hypothetical protein
MLSLRLPFATAMPSGRADAFAPNAFIRIGATGRSS